MSVPWAAPGQTVKHWGNDAARETVENQTAVSHRSHSRLEIANIAIPTFPQCRREEGLAEHTKPRALAAVPALAEVRSEQKKGASDNIQAWNRMSLALQAHAALEQHPDGRLIAHGNEKSFSGSFLDWKMLALA